MTQEEKELLLRDLCARLPYGVKCAAVTTNNEPNTIGGYCEVLDDFYIREVGGWFNISMIKPYLRPMSSMTDEEREQYRKFSYYGAAGMRDNDFTEMVAAPSFEKMDYLNSHHFDYRGLIEKGLAIKAPKDMYEY